MDITVIQPDIELRLSLGQSMRMISKEFGLDRKSLTKALKEAGVCVPSRSDAAKNTWKNHTHPHKGKKGKASYMYGRHPTPEAIARQKAAVSGPNNYHWSGGTKKHSGGYVLVYAPDHPHRDRNGFVLEHRLVMEKAIGRILDESEIVHHKNLIKDDNRIENLQVMNREEHARLHANLKG